MPHRTVTEGDTVFIRARVLTAASTSFEVLIEDDRHKLTVWVPPTECARREDIDRLKEIRRTTYFLDR